MSNRKIKITEEIIQRVQEAKAEGMIWSQAVKKLHLPKDIVLSCWNGHPRDSRIHNFSDEEKYEVQEMYQKGYSVAQIAIELGTSWYLTRRLLDSMCLYD